MHVFFCFFKILYVYDFYKSGKSNTTSILKMYALQPSKVDFQPTHSCVRIPRLSIWMLQRFEGNSCNTKPLNSRNNIAFQTLFSATLCIYSLVLYLTASLLKRIPYSLSLIAFLERSFRKSWIGNGSGGKR